MRYLYIEGRREAYAPSQIEHTLTVGELIDYLTQFDEDTPVLLNNDRGYTYGSISYSSFSDEEEEEPEDEEEA